MRSLLPGSALVAALLVAAAGVASAQPVINSVYPALTSANTGATVTLTGTGFGAAGDTVRFPGFPYTPVTPTSYAAGSVTVRVPMTWSGPVSLRSASSGLLSNSLDLEITYSLTGQFWNTAALPFTWYMNSAGSPGCTSSETYGALTTAFQTWDCASGVAQLGGGSTSSTGSNHSDGVSVQWWRSSGLPSSVVALTTWRYSASTNEISEFDIEYNSGDFTFSCDGSPGTFDVQSVATHECGHAIGLADLYGSLDWAETMNGTGAPGLTHQRTLHLHDALGAEDLYPHSGRANLTVGIPSGWYSSIVPRPVADATSTSCPLPASVPGHVTSYLNFAIGNNGMDCASPSRVNDTYLDDSSLTSITSIRTVAVGGAASARVNLPVKVRGGRHTVKQVIDADDDQVESNENDNVDQRQYVWTPLALTNQLSVRRPRARSQGALASPNCDGFSFVTNWWGAVGIVPRDTGDDYELELHDNASILFGFSSPLAQSFDSGTRADFVLVNGRSISGQGLTYYGGVWPLGADPAYSHFHVQQSNEIGSTLMPGTAYGSSVASPVVAVDTADVVKLHEVFLTDTGTTYTFALENLSGSADLDMGLYGQDTYLGKLDYLAISQLGVPGANESFDYRPPVAGYYAVVVWRRDQASMGLANTYQLRVGPALSNLRATLAPSGWFEPLVPRNAPGATPSSTWPTATLNGNAAGTWLNWAIHQQGPAATPGFRSEVWLDEGQQLAFTLHPAPVAPGVYTQNDVGPFTIRGGRHTLHSIADPSDVVAESSEDDNLYHHTQWVWSPLGLAKGVGVARAAPPDPGTFAMPNADGFMIMRDGLYATAVGAAGLQPGDDYDLHLYDDYSGSLAGFSNERKLSSVGGNGTDFVMVSMGGGIVPLFPAVSREAVSGGPDSTAVDWNDSNGRVGYASAMWADQKLAPYRLVNVYEATLAAGLTYHFLLTRTSGTSDLTFALFPPTSGFFARMEAAAFSTPFGSANDTLLYTAAASGRHPIVVYRLDGLVAGTPATYDLHWNIHQLLDAGGSPPRALEFAGATPNPALGSARLEFALPAAGHARLDLYDIRGRLVRRLADAEFPPGPSSVRWDGRGEGGAPAGAGIYWARLEAAGRKITRRVTLLR